ncbi:MAG: NAD(P)H-dependent oxidoreductase [Candidatus Methanomethylophilaceae archaeon]|jgi:multimeric flavodoxin WrbA
MKVVIVHGQMHKGITYHITQMLVSKAFEGADIDEYFLPEDGPGFCIGCENCFYRGEENCPDHDKMEAVVGSMISSDCIVIDSPTYCMGVSGQLKALFDHMGYMWMAHRPEPSMFKKIGIGISSCAGKGSEEIVDFIRQQMQMWGVPTTFGLPVVAASPSWEKMSPDKLDDIQEETSKLASKISKAKPSPGAKEKIIYKFMKKNQENNVWNPRDREHWEKQGWLDGKSPWE